MKPIHLNLAAKPYRDFRAVYAVVVVASLLIAFLLVTNVETYLRYVKETRTTRDETEKLQELASRERERTAVAEQKIASTDVESLALQTSFINARLAERAFSWSELLDALEKTLPDDVRLVSIAPTFTPSGDVSLNLQLEGKTSNAMVRTLERMLANPKFSSPFPGNDTVSGDVYRFTIVSGFKPSVARMVKP